MSNREHWLTEVARGLEPVFKSKGFPLREYRLTCGWPAKSAMSTSPRIGECHGIRNKDTTQVKESSGSLSRAEIFISPLIDAPAEVAGVVAHELIHAAVGCKEGHKGKFILACKSLGMVGKPTVALPGPALGEKILRIIDGIGYNYPHKAIEKQVRAVKASNDVTMVCECGCKVRISLKWLDNAGPPTCGCGSLMIPKGD